MVPKDSGGAKKKSETEIGRAKKEEGSKSPKEGEKIEREEGRDTDRTREKNSGRDSEREREREMDLGACHIGRLSWSWIKEPYYSIILP